MGVTVFNAERSFYICVHVALANYRRKLSQKASTIYQQALSSDIVALLTG